MPQKDYAYDTRMNVRPARPDDAEPVSYLWRQNAEYHASFDPGFAPKDDGHFSWRNFFSKCAQNPNSFVLLAENAGTVVGFVLGTIAHPPPSFDAQSNVTLFDLMVAEDARGKGIGKQLLDAARTWALDRNIKELRVNVASSNERALAFYRREGFGELMHNLKLNMA